jgi:hypothetical protein
VMLSRRFHSGQLSELTMYAGELEEIVHYATRGQWGCFVETTPMRDGRVRVRMYERSFAADEVHTELHAERTFDADAVADSAAFAEELRDWAARRNERAEQDMADAEDERRSELEEQADRQREARELAEILRRAGG